MIRIVVGAVVASALVFGLLGYLLGRPTSRSATLNTSTTLPAVLFQGQGRDWVAQHGADLTLISTWAKNLADAVQAHNSRLADLAVREMLIQVGRADGDLPSNAFGAQLHQVFLQYVAALDQIQAGLVKGNQSTFVAGSDALASAVSEFTTITNQLKVGAG